MAATATAKQAPLTAEQQQLRAQLAVMAPDSMVEWLNILVYGDPGAGKTWFEGTAMDHPMTFPALILDVEGGIKTLRHRPNIDVIPIRAISKLEETYEKLHQSIQPDGTMYYRTVGIDSLTELADLDMKVIMDQAFNTNPDKVDKDVPSQREWGKSRSHIRKIVRAFRDLPCNVVYTASVATVQEENMPNKYFPGFAGKLRTEVPGFMDIVGFMQTKVDPINGEVTRTLQVQGTNRVVAKDRTSALPAIVEDPSIPKLWEYITQSNSGS